MWGENGRALWKLDLAWKHDREVSWHSIAAKLLDPMLKLQLEAWQRSIMASHFELIYYILCGNLSLEAWQRSIMASHFS